MQKDPRAHGLWLLQLFLRTASLNTTFSLFILQRYYGESMPFGPDQSFQDDKIGYLTVEQALADYAVLLTELKTQFQATESKVVAFGGR